MFRLITEPTFRRTVTVRVPSPTAADAIEEQSFEVEFAALHEDEAKAIDAAHAALSPAERAERPWHVLHRVTRGWSGVVDDTGSDVPFTAAALTQALGWPWVGPAMMDAWRAGLAGEEARLGN